PRPLFLPDPCCKPAPLQIPPPGTAPATSAATACGQMGLRNLLNKLHERRQDPVRFHRKARDLANLAEENVNGYTVQESYENWLGQKIRHEAQPQQTGQNAEDP